MTTTPYQNLELQPLAGQWRSGSSQTQLPVLNPYTGEELLKLNLATKDDMEQAFVAARDAQVGWAAMGPAARAAVLGAWLNVRINAASIKDRNRVEDLLKEAAGMAELARQKEDAILEIVNAKI